MRLLLVRAARVLLLLVLVLVIAFLGGGGWYFSGQIHASALAVEHTAPTSDLVLQPRGGGRVAIATTDTAALTELRSGSTYGVAWRGGYGQVSGPASDVDGGVLRRLRLLSGSAPTAGTRAHLDGDAFPADPAVALGQPVQDVTYPSGRASLPAWFVPGLGGNSRGTWAVLVHGKGVTRTEMLRPMRDTVAAGLPSLDITYRNDAGAPRDPSGLYQFGATEWHDLAAAVAYARAHGADRVVLVGASMGGGIIASYLEHRTDRVPVAGLVLDAPMLDLAETVRFGAQQRPLPLFGHVPDPLTWSAERITSLRDGVDWRAVDYLVDPSWLTMPALVLHGRADTTVPLRTSVELRDERPGRVRLVTAPGAEHVESWNVDPRGYDRAVGAFLTRVSR